MAGQLIRYESGQRGRYVFEGREFLWDLTKDPIRVVARSPEDQESVADFDFLKIMLENLFADLGIDVDDLEIY